MTRKILIVFFEQKGCKEVGDKKVEQGRSIGKEVYPNFGYYPKMEGYLTLMSDITELYAIALNGEVEENAT